MTDQTIQRKLNQLTKISNELVEEVMTRHPKGQLFYECEGSFCFMDGDSDGSSVKRQHHIKFQSEGNSQMDCGAW